MKAALLIVLAALCSEIYGHSYLTNPTPRSRFTACRIGGPPEFPLNCPGPCEANYNVNQQITTVARGQAYTVQWPRNNHAGGFIRLSFVSAGTPETHANFDANAVYYACHEVSCDADAGPGDDGGDSNGADGTVNPCIMPITIPTHLTDGRWTMQWSWYGGGGGYLGDYYSCANLNVAGGAAVTSQPEPTFVGGDVSNPTRSDICEYWQTNKLHYCISEPCLDICQESTAPLGHCQWPAANGRPYMESIVSKVSSTQTGACRTYTSADVPKNVASQVTQLTSTLNVPESFNVGSLTINNVQGSAEWLGMFNLYLENPAGERIMVWSRKDCGTGGNYQFSISESANSVVWPCPPSSGGTYKPVDSFGWFIGRQAQGNWKLIFDSQDDCCNGALNAWGITLCEVAGINPPPATTGAYVAPQTTTTTTTTTGDDGTPTVNVKVTVSLPVTPASVDVTTFTYEVVDVLDLPLNAISEILVDLDASTNSLTYVQFILTNVLKSDGTRVDPVAAAVSLRDMASTNDRKLQNSLMLRGLQFVDSEVSSSSADDAFPLTYIIIAAVGGAVVLIAIAIIVAAVIVRKKKNKTFY